MQKPDPEPGTYYVTAIDGGRYVALLGPFPTHQEALDNVSKARKKAIELDPWAAFYAIGTVKVDNAYRRPGCLNQFFPELNLPA